MSLIKSKIKLLFDVLHTNVHFLVFGIVLWGIIGARLYYVLFTLNKFDWTFTEILQVWNGGLAIYGGIILGGLFIFIKCKKKKR